MKNIKKNISKRGKRKGGTSPPIGPEIPSYPQIWTGPHEEQTHAQAQTQAQTQAQAQAQTTFYSDQPFIHDPQFDHLERILGAGNEKYEKYKNKEVLGKNRVIYKKKNSKSKKEYIKYNKNYILVKEYIKLKRKKLKK